jgi:digeranylgeranylglycerophospholipid reductase
MAERFDVLVVGAGPAGCTAARIAAGAGARVLLAEKRPIIGLPVQCAEYVPVQIIDFVPLPERCIAQRIRRLCTRLPDGETVETPAAGYVLDRASFDKALTVAARRAGAEIWSGARVTERTEGGVFVRRGGQDVEVACRIIIGADGPRSTVGGWIGQANERFIDALQVEAVLPEPVEETQVYFDPVYQGGYGWLFPKGDTANVGVGVSRALGGDPQQALDHLLDRLGIWGGDVVGRTGGPVPSSGPAGSIREGNILLVGDAAGHTHAVTGAGIFSAVVGGALAGEAVGRAIKTDDLSALSEYEREWEAFLGGPMRHAVSKRQYLDLHWSDDPGELSDVIRKTWIAFKDYGRREGGERDT